MLLARQKKLLKTWFETPHGQHMLQTGYVAYDDLPPHLREGLEKIKDQETLWCDAERHLGDLKCEQRMGTCCG